MSPGARTAVLFSWLPLLASLAACGGGGGRNAGSTTPPPPPEVDGPVLMLTNGNPNGEDDDPTIALDAAGNVHVVWFSDRDGSKDLYAIRSTAIDLASGTITWSTPIQITNNDPVQFPPPSRGDNFPALLIDETGTHHLAWHRWNLANETHIQYARSDGTAAGWAAASVVDVTTGPNFDRFPDVVKLAADDLRIYFGSKTRATANKNDIFMTRSTDGGTTWGAPAAVATLNTPGEQSHFPHVQRLQGGAFIGTFARWKLEPSNDALDPSSDVFYAESADATNWTVERVTSDGADVQNDLVPDFFLDQGGAVHLAWTSIAFGDPAGDNVQMRTADRASFPNLVSRLSSAVGTADHSPQLAAVTVGGRQVFVMVWVRIIAPPRNQVVYRIFSRL